MDDALVQGTPEDVQTRWIAVLILVLMDDALVLLQTWELHQGRQES